MELLTEKKGRSKTSNAVIGVESAPQSSSEDKDYEIALRAYYKAEARGYEPGHEIQDWLDAGAEVMVETEREKNK